MLALSNFHIILSLSQLLLALKIANSHSPVSAWTALSEVLQSNCNTVEITFADRKGVVHVVSMDTSDLAVR
jgi:hypothetical protein